MNFPTVTIGVVLVLFFCPNEGLTSESVHIWDSDRIFDSGSITEPRGLTKTNNNENATAAKAVALLKPEPDSGDINNQNFRSAKSLLDENKLDQAVQKFSANIAKKGSLELYNHYYLALTYRKMGKLKEAAKEFKTALDSSPNLKLEIDSKVNLGEMALQDGNFKEAQEHLGKIEKRTRNTELYPDVLYDLTLLARGLKNQKNFCKWMVTLYSHYPAYPKIKDWDVDLDKNLFENSPHNCHQDVDDVRTRVRFLLWSGLDQKAQNEIAHVREKLIKEDPFAADQLQAQFFLQQGEILKAYDLLKPYYSLRKSNFGFLLFFGTAAARAGDNKVGVEAHYLAYKLRPNTKEGRQALYQAAFMSYQSLDYNGAENKFNEFIKKYSGSGLVSEAKWHLAWIKYLKGNYHEALNVMVDLQKGKVKHHKQWKTISVDRIQFWTAMCLLRMRKFEQARTIFSALSNDNLQGYYSVAANYRLKKMNADGLAKRQRLQGARPLGRFPLVEFMMPSMDYDPAAGDADAEEAVVMNPFVDADKLDEEATGLESDSEAQTLGLTDGQQQQQPMNGANFRDPKMIQRFERARDLMIVGLNDWARWDLYDIERQTRNREYLRLLMSEYSTIENYHRSSYIAQTTFSSQRNAHGIEGVKFLWELAYPRAFQNQVEKYSKEFEVPLDLSWSIMRTESQFRKDAISPVGAMGLMQVMPITGYRLAKILKVDDFSPKDLLQSEVSIKFGTRYLRRLLDQFDGLTPLVAAAYNAGPHRVYNWLGAFGKLDTDEFIEHIPFVETRNYVKKVMSSSYVYSQLYGQKKKDIFGYLSEPIPYKSKIQGSYKENWDDI